MANGSSPTPPPGSIWRFLLQHPVIPLVIGFLIALDGPESVVVRIVGLYLMATWLCFDMRPLIHASRFGLWRHLLFGCFCSAAALGTFLVCYWLIQQRLDEELRTVRGGLTAVALTSSNQHVFFSHFTVINDSGYQIGKHSIRCGVNLIATGYGDYSISNIVLRPLVFDGPIEPNKDSQTIECLDVFMPNTDVDCLDIVLRIDYVLTEQPNTYQHKEFRLVAKKDAGFSWFGQALDDPTSYCLDYLSPHAKKELQDYAWSHLKVK